jgi:gamma-glutamylcyclotransferase (GGCT)/AIG2-like uncharacterized protein YtfP
MSNDHLFVYGTLRRDSKSEMYHLLARYGDFVDDAVCRGKLYMVNDYPGLVTSDNPRDVVHGEVYKLRCPEVVLSALDVYEECGLDFPEPTEYVRRKENVTLKSGKIVTAWVYIFNRTTGGLKLIEAGDFYRELR